MSRPFQAPWSRLIATATLIGALPLVSQGAQGNAKADSCALPTALRAALQERFGSSRVLTLSDLYEDERATFNRDHKGACPGTTAGRFFGVGERPATAIVLLGVGPKQDMRLVVARPALSSWTFVELERMDPGGTAVVSTGRPGDLKAPSGAKARTRDNDVLLLTAIETWQRAYVWNGRTFETVQTKD
jgi:hypothetical protein